jgi:hypothetical protein
MNTKVQKDYLSGCPVCGVRHKRDKLIGLTRMNRHCWRAFERAGPVKRKVIRDRSMM